MTRQEEIETIEKAFNMALMNGWMPEQLQTGSDEDKIRYIKKDILRSRLWLFDHDFAKALWGDAETTLSDTGEWEMHPEQEKADWVWVMNLPRWQYHLQQMVIADDPIQYLQEYI